MKTNRNTGIVRVALGVAIAAALAACGHSAPSASDAKAVLESRIAGCPYLSLTDFSKTNGIPGDDPTSYRVEVSYSMKLEPTDDQKDQIRHIAEDNQKIRALQASYNEKLSAVPNDPDAGQKILNDEATEIGTVQTDMSHYLTIPGFYQKVFQECPDVQRQFVRSFEDQNATLREYTDTGATRSFTETISMAKTDNGWQAAR
ncbi:MULTISPECIES: hypothetical protein [Paraburkholderia]|uniref:Lipoprotein n=1 Tax=Paraburkholderia madseniana TaxID=2599607 RepID=A0AAP5EPK3_9BURK|nr:MULTISPECIES: hypothetical protein [Paraburkholderia]MCX4146903.1 hypothetical protein [Paraburkholderia madseniana]MDN7149849.1 hypothetical protein [Paraburkholderia sp. WS6]MDQ6408729.1 hypothetical protein [Paraburkholderia madseniana]